MEPIVPLLKRPKFPEPSDDVDATAARNRFNDLPETVVHHIFSFLETIDVIRVSGVSTNWRYLWTSMPQFNFDYKRREFSFSRIYEKYKDFINWVLMAHDKSGGIQSFRLSCLNNEDDHSLYRWVNILAKKHVQELYLNVTSNNETPFALPCCLIASDSLEILDLDLQESVLEIPSHAGFSRLKSLQLASTKLMDQNLFQNFISSCPLLENLSLEGCMFHDFKILDISSRNLRKLVMNCDFCEVPFDEGLWKCDLKIACPNLVYFDLSGPFVQSLSWDKTPSFLRTAIIFAFRYDDPVPNEELANFVLKILRGVCHVEVLKLRLSILEYIYPAVAKPGSFATTFYNLKSLRLSIGLEECYSQSLIYLLKCAPSLELLSVHIDIEDEWVYEWKIPDEAIACLTCHLKMVKLIDIDCIGNELELIRFLLKNGHVLRKMSIIWNSGVQQETQKEAIQKVMKLPRSSSNVTVTFSEPKQLGCYEL
ncbi:hypothetical protein REPUB_Repub12eG0206600 [Reevesia pubescens]